jgi:hypothetical protein
MQNNKKYIIATLLALCMNPLVCKETCPPPVSEKPETWNLRMRLKALKKLDQFLNVSTSQSLKTYPLAKPLQQKKIQVDIPEMREFVEKYGYFSLTHPLVSKVSSGTEDIALASCLLKALYDRGAKGEYLEIATAEVLTKVLAYRDLKVGLKVSIPVEREGIIHNEVFCVDRIFDMWHGMPAFGLIPESKDEASLLLFRGTDFSLVSQRGWASMLSDLDISGPGLYAFQHAQKKISEWLRSVARIGKAARVIGCSLGGALATYTFIYENIHLAERGSISVCPPGVAQKVIEDWLKLPADRRNGLTSYVYEGDLVSKVGHLFGTVYCLFSPQPCKPLTAHTQLISSEPLFFKALVEVKD